MEQETWHSLQMDAAGATEEEDKLDLSMQMFLANVQTKHQLPTLK